MEVEEATDKNEEWETMHRDMMMQDSDIALNENPGDMAMIIHPHAYPQPQPYDAQAKPDSPSQSYHPDQTRSPTPELIHLIATHTRTTSRPLPSPIHTTLLYPSTQPPTPTTKPTTQAPITTPTEANKPQPH